MPCAIPPVDQSASQLGWGFGTFLGPRGGSVRPVWHKGIDFMADAGSPVVAPWPGTVVASGVDHFGGVMGFSRDALGHWVTLSHGVVEAGQYPVWTRYGQLRAASTLVPGARVEQGALIGFVGTSGLAPENRDRPRLFFQAVTTERAATDPRSSGSNPMRYFFNPLGVVRDGGETPGRPMTPYEIVPDWGGRLVQQDVCAAGGVSGLRGLDPRRQRPIYERYGSTQLSSTARYLPADYGEEASSGGGGTVVVLGLAALVGGVLLLRRRPQKDPPPWWIRRRRWA